MKIPVYIILPRSERIRGPQVSELCHDNMKAAEDIHSLPQPHYATMLLFIWDAVQLASVTTDGRTDTTNKRTEFPELSRPILHRVAK